MICAAPILAKPCPEYDCTSCGRSMVVLVGDAPAAPICHRCRMLPGWHRRPEIVDAYDRDEAALALAPLESTGDLHG